MKIVVLGGGLSPERDVSLCSASLISNALMEKGHQVLMLDLYYGVRKPEDQIFRTINDNKLYSYSIPDKEPNLEELIRINNNRNIPIGDGIIEMCLKADVVFLALHGGMGENGQIQATLESYGIKFTGSKYLGCAIAMDKGLSKILMKAAGILTPEWKSYTSECASAEEVINDVGIPCAIKPVGCGSSVGVSLVHTEEELYEAIQAAKKYGQDILAEKLVIGREFSISVLNGNALPPIEIIPKTGFYDYKSKYQAGLTTEICPAELSEELTKKAQAVALAVHKALMLKDYSRTDVILDNDGNYWCLEANNLPGMTPNSLLPQEARASGISYNDLCETIAELGLK